MSEDSALSVIQNLWIHACSTVIDDEGGTVSAGEHLAEPAVGEAGHDADHAITRRVVLGPDALEHVAQGTLPADEEKILAYVREHGSINNAECRELLGVYLHRASYLLKRLAAEGKLKREGEHRWAHYRLP